MVVSGRLWRHRQRAVRAVGRPRARSGRRRRRRRVAVAQAEPLSDQAGTWSCRSSRAAACRASRRRSATRKWQARPPGSTRPATRGGRTSIRRRAAGDGSVSPAARRARVRFVVGRVAVLQRPLGRWPRAVLSHVPRRAGDAPGRSIGGRAPATRSRRARRRTTPRTRKWTSGRRSTARPTSTSVGNQVRLEGLRYRISLRLRAEDGGSGDRGDADARSGRRPIAPAGRDPRRARLAVGLRRAGAVRPDLRHRSPPAARPCRSTARPAITITTGDSGATCAGSGDRWPAAICRSCTGACFRRPMWRIRIGCPGFLGVLDRQGLVAVATNVSIVGRAGRRAAHRPST